MLKKVYELEGLLLDLESHLIGKKPDFMADTKATSYLNKSVYDYEKDARLVLLYVKSCHFCTKCQTFRDISVYLPLQSLLDCHRWVECIAKDKVQRIC